MRILAIDSSGPACSVAALEAGEVVAHRSEQMSRGHAERMVPMIEAVRLAADWPWSGIGAIAVCVGPGGFTGLRVAVATARGLALASGCGILPVTTFAAIAGAMPVARPLVIVLDGGRGEIFWQRFAADGSVDLPMAGTPGSAAAAIAAGDLVAGSGCALLPGHAGTIIASVDATTDARYVATVAWRHWSEGERPSAGAAVSPLYLRGPDARLDAGRPLVAGTQ